MTNIGNLNATLSLSAFEFNNGLKQSETAAMEFATTTEVQSQRANNALNSIGRNTSGSFVGKTAGVVQQVGFAMQDFSSQFSTRGIGPAIGAVTNNVQMLGMAFGPIPAAIGAVGGALAGVLLPRLLETGSIFGKTKDEMSAFEKQVHDLSEKTFAPWRELENTKFDVLKGTEKQLDDRLGSMRHKYRMLLEEREGEKAAMATATNQDEITARKKRVDELDQQMRGVTKTGVALQKLRPELQAGEAFEAAVKEKEKRQKMEDDIRKKSLEQYGTESQKLESRLAAERDQLAQAGVNKEAMQRFEAMSAVERKKLEMSTAEKELSKMGQAAGMSAGAQRDSAAGIAAINRAVSGTTSEQSMAKRAIKLQEDELKKLEELVRKPVQKINMVALSG